MRKTLFIHRQCLLDAYKLNISINQQQLRDLTDKQMVRTLLQKIRIHKELVDSEDELFEVRFNGKEDE